VVVQGLEPLIFADHVALYASSIALRMAG